MGPAYEELLNNAPQRLNAKRRYTGGHFPESFEYSSVGGWIVTLGSGQASTYYGDMYDIVLSQEYVTPAGIFKTHEYPGTATGPKVNDIMKGSEGSFGVLVSATLRIFRYHPENRQKFAFIFGTLNIFVLILSVVLFFSSLSRESSTDYGILLTSVVTAKISPDAQSNDAFVIHEGIKFKIEDEVNNWVKIKLSDGKIGWVPSNTFEVI